MLSSPNRQRVDRGATLSLIFSSVIATFPGESYDNQVAAWPLFSTTDQSNRNIRVSLHDWIFNGLFDPATGGRRSMLSATLILPALNIYDGLKIDDPAKTGWRKYVFVAGHRNLRGAIFDSSSLPKVDFTGADLQGASLIQADLQSVSLDGAQLQGAKSSAARTFIGRVTGSQFAIFGGFARRRAASGGQARLC